MNINTLNQTARWAAYSYADKYNVTLTKAQQLNKPKKAVTNASEEDLPYYEGYVADDVWYTIKDILDERKIEQLTKQLRKERKSDAEIFSRLYLQIETDYQQRYTSSRKPANFSQKRLDMIKILGEIAAEDVRTQKINIDKLKSIDAAERESVIGSTYREAYQILLDLNKH
ncbi:MAG: hypothetical protein QM666_11390 [Acinetobacter sp.]